MIFDAKHEMIRKLVRQFAETELTTEVLDKVEEKYFASDATVAPGGWCCWCWCCNSASVWG